MAPRWILPLILGLCLAARLWGVASPLTGIHAWRQCDTAAVARNFATEDMNILRPRVDWRADGPGFAEMEFPVFPFAAAAVYRVIGVHEWVGRLLAALGAVVACWYVYRLVRWTTGETIALWSAAVFAVLPLNTYYGRAFMPESWMLAATAAGVFHFARWTEGRRAGDWLLGAAGIALAVLLKLPALYLGLPLLWLAFHAAPKGLGLGARWRGALADPLLWAFAAAVLAPVGAWYAWAHRLGAESGLSFGVWHSDKFAAWDMTLNLRYWYELLIEKIFERHLTWAGVFPFLAGVWLGRTNARERLFDVWSVALLVYFALVAKGNSIHEYYQMPLAIPGAFYLGRGMEWLWNRRRAVAAVFCVAIVALSVGRLVEYERRARRTGEPALRLAAVFRSLADSRGPVIVVSGKLPGDPSLLYYTGAKGWALGPESLPESEVRRLSGSARYVLGVHHTLERPEDRDWVGRMAGQYPVLHSDEDGFILELRPGIEKNP